MSHTPEQMRKKEEARKESEYHAERNVVGEKNPLSEENIEKYNKMPMTKDPDGILPDKSYDRGRA